MKFYNLFSLLLFVFVLASCHKYDTEEEKAERTIPGDYEWKESQSLQDNGASGQPLYSYTPSSLKKNVGLRIKKNKKCFLFENGKQIDSGEILKIEHKTESLGYYSYITFQEITIDWNERADIVFTKGLNGSYLVNSTLPVEGFTNCFQVK